MEKCRLNLSYREKREFFERLKNEKPKRERIEWVDLKTRTTKKEKE